MLIWVKFVKISKQKFERQLTVHQPVLCSLIYHAVSTNQSARYMETIMISNGNRAEWSPIRSVIIRVITKSDDRAAGVRFVYHEYDYRLNWTTQSPIIN